MTQQLQAATQYVSLQAAAARWSVSVDAIRDLIASGQLAAYRLNRRILRVDVDELDACFKQVPTARAV